jgi:reactive chlorine resistance protein C
MYRKSRYTDGLSSVGLFVSRAALVTNLLGIGRLKFKDYEVANIQPLISSSPLFSPLNKKLGSRNLARVIGVTELALGLMIGLHPVAPKVSAIGGVGAIGMFLTTLSFLATTPEAREEGQGMLTPSITGQFLLKDGVLLGASIVATAESLRSLQRR